MQFAITFTTLIAIASAAAILPRQSSNNTTTDGLHILLGDCTIANTTETSAAILYNSIGANATSIARGQIASNGTFHDWDNGKPFTVGLGVATLEMKLKENADSGAEALEIVGGGILTMNNGTRMSNEQEVEMVCVKAEEGGFKITEGVECIPKFHCAEDNGEQQE